MRDDGRLEITVRNGLRSPVPEARADHHGIVGMRERAGLLGGTLEAGADDAPTRCGRACPWSEDVTRNESASCSSTTTT